jgi:hypothetical protein
MLADLLLCLEKNFAMADTDIDPELKQALEDARDMDSKYQVMKATPLDDWLGKYAPDVWANKKEKVEGGTIAENGLFYPDPETLRDPADLLKWGNDLRRDVLTLIAKKRDITTEELRATLSTWPEHSDLIKYYSLVFECITQRIIQPPYYMKLLAAMCNSQTRIRNGEDAIKVELELDRLNRRLKIDYGVLKET